MNKIYSLIWDNKTVATNQVVPEPNKESRLFWLLRKANSVASQIRSNHFTIRYILELDYFANHSKLVSVIKFLNDTKARVNATSVLSVLDLYEKLPKLHKAVAKIGRSSGLKKVVNIVKSASQVSSVTWTFHEVRTGLEYFTSAVKISGTVSTVFGKIFVVGGYANHALNIRSYYKAKARLTKFVKITSIQDDVKRYQALKDYIKTTSAKTLGKEFNVDGTALQNSINLTLASKQPGRSGFSDQHKQDLDQLIKSLEDRLSWEQQNKAISLFFDAKTLLLTPLLTTPATQIALFIYLFVVSTIRGGHNQVQKYRFESQIGLIDRGEESSPSTTLEKIKDFGRWYFSYYSKPVISKEIISLTHKINQQLIE